MLGKEVKNSRFGGMPHAINSMKMNKTYIALFVIPAIMLPACQGKPASKHKPTSGTCGPRALSGVVRYYRLSVSWDSLAMVAGTTDKGTSMLGLSNAAKHLGFDAVGLQTDYQGLKDIPLPSIIYIDGNHFTTLMWVGADSVLVEDEGRKDFWKRDSLLRRWQGQVLALYPGKDLQERMRKTKNDKP